jgi:hypothetical protein
MCEGLGSKRVYGRRELSSEDMLIGGYGIGIAVGVMTVWACWIGLGCYMTICCRLTSATRFLLTSKLALKVGAA